MSEDEVTEAAASWYARQDSDDMDWPAFTAWLEADPRHAPAFDAVALLGADVDRHRDALHRLLPSDHVEPTPVRRRWRWGLVGGGIAAAAAVVLVVTTHDVAPPRVPPTAMAYRAEAATRDVRIADSQVTLAPGSRITAQSDDPTRLALTGRAVFAVRHDPSRTLVVSAAGYSVSDVGTRFEIVTGAGAVRVSVAEGAVAIRSPRGGNPVGVAAGQTATGYPDGRIMMGRTSPGALDGWRSGSLVYDAMPLGLVAADVGRATRRSIIVDPAFVARPFSGVLAHGNDATMIDALAALSGLEARRQGDTVHLGDRPRR